MAERAVRTSWRGQGGGEEHAMMALFSHLPPFQSDGKMMHVVTSLVVRWLRIHLPMQGTPVQPLVWEDPTRLGATKPGCHDY